MIDQLRYIDIKDPMGAQARAGAPPRFIYCVRMRTITTAAFRFPVQSVDNFLDLTKVYRDEYHITRTHRKRYGYISLEEKLVLLYIP